MNKFAERLKELRLEQGLSKNQLAAEIKYSHSVVEKWENKKRSPNLEAIIALCNYFKVSADYLIGFVD